jgi:hypothetical protein
MAWRGSVLVFSDPRRGNVSRSRIPIRDYEYVIPVGAKIAIVFLRCKKKTGQVVQVRPAQRAIDNLGEKNLKLTCSVGPSFLKPPDSPELILEVLSAWSPLRKLATTRRTLCRVPCCQGSAGFRPDLPRERRTTPKYFKCANSRRTDEQSDLGRKLALVKLNSAEAGQSHGQEGLSIAQRKPSDGSSFHCRPELEIKTSADADILPG